ncbi:hypothetical protein EYF80_033833 [Liparis tanakae]|uniref:Uncharacterized protein n=1 Tax=Liparis tanakae TaxID=230148 RepID=A0A4Z2GR54_9TELE|nr:hypothetical protein EYF80_033833 [Liparis tanakae]
MKRILRSDMVVKLANRLLRTYSPGLLSGSMLMGNMAGAFWTENAWISFKECPAHVATFHIWQTQHLPRPLMKLMTLALLQHTAVPSIAGKEDMANAR